MRRFGLIKCTRLQDSWVEYSFPLPILSSDFIFFINLHVSQRYEYGLNVKNDFYAKRVDWVRRGSYIDGFCFCDDLVNRFVDTARVYLFR